MIRPRPDEGFGGNDGRAVGENKSQRSARRSACRSPRPVILPPSKPGPRAEPQNRKPNLCSSRRQPQSTTERLLARKRKRQARATNRRLSASKSARERFSPSCWKLGWKLDVGSSIRRAHSCGCGRLELETLKKGMIHWKRTLREGHADSLASADAPRYWHASLQSSHPENAELFADRQRGKLLPRRCCPGSLHGFGHG